MHPNELIHVVDTLSEKERYLLLCYFIGYVGEEDFTKALFNLTNFIDR